MRQKRVDILTMKWEYKTIAGQPHRKKRNRVQAMWLDEWCDVPKQMWDFCYKPTEEVTK